MPHHHEKGFSLTELMTTLAIIGIISAALIGVMNNLNQQSERMNTQADLLLAGRQIMDLVEPWAALAGHKQRPNPLPLNKAFEILDSGARVKFCFDVDALQRRQIEFQMADKKLQTRSENNSGCTAPPNPTDWEDISEQVLEGLAFSRPVINGASSPVLDVKIDLERFIPGVDEAVNLSMRKRLSMFSLVGL